MKLDRLFGVLVLGGAALGIEACEYRDGGADAALPPDDAATTSSRDAAADGSDAAMLGSDAAATTDASGAACTGAPSDPCGCPCCWAMAYPNTDEVHCGGFCSAGDNGRGCCGG